MRTVTSGTPSLTLNHFLVRTPKQLQLYPFNQDRIFFFFSARYALSAAIQSLRIPSGKKILLPSYNCGTEIDPVLYQNLNVKFYKINTDLLIDPKDLESKIDEDTAAAVVTHYFGFSQPLDEIATICRKRNLYLIEDCAHAFLSEHEGIKLGEAGDMSIFSIRKTLPMPDGGMLVINNPAIEYKPAKETIQPNLFSTLLALSELYDHKPRLSTDSHYQRCLSLFVIQPSLLILKSLRLCIRLYKKLFKVKTTPFLVNANSQDFRRDITNWGMSQFSRRILFVSDFRKIKEIRRANYQYLLEWFNKHFPEVLVIRNLPKGVCPLYFPILLTNRDRINEYLRAMAVGSWCWWAFFHPAVPWKEFEDSRFLKENLLVLPVHQDLNKVHLDWMLRSFVGAVSQVQEHK